MVQEIARQFKLIHSANPARNVAATKQIARAKLEFFRVRFIRSTPAPGADGARLCPQDQPQRDRR
jgi:hypothetical protein